jgi:hypothetical protein
MPAAETSALDPAATERSLSAALLRLRLRWPSLRATKSPPACPPPPPTTKPCSSTPTSDTRSPLPSRTACCCTRCCTAPWATAGAATSATLSSGTSPPTSSSTAWYWPSPAPPCPPAASSTSGCSTSVLRRCLSCWSATWPPPLLPAAANPAAANPAGRPLRPARRGHLPHRRPRVVSRRGARRAHALGRHRRRPGPRRIPLRRGRAPGLG